MNSTIDIAGFHNCIILWMFRLERGKGQCSVYYTSPQSVKQPFLFRWLDQWLKRLDTLNEQTNENPRLSSQQIRKRYYKTLETIVIKTPMSPPYLVLLLSLRIVNPLVAAIADDFEFGCRPLLYSFHDQGVKCKFMPKL